MTFSKSGKCQLIILLILLNFIIRIPSVPHEMGNDGFTIHILANLVSASGYAGWWAHPSSIFGFYPYSYASAVPFLLSGISQVTGIEMEITIWIFSVFVGLFSAFAAYILAKVIWNNDIFKFLVAFSFSLSPGILTFSTWDISTRGLFFVILPLFIYLLLKILISKTKSDQIKHGLLFLILFVLLMATHHYIFMTIPIIMGFTIVLISSKLSINRFFKTTDYIINVGFLAGLLGMLLIPFFTGMFISGSRYGALNRFLENGIRYSGILFIFAIPGLVYLSVKINKKIEEWFLLFVLFMIIPLFYQETYVHYFFVVLSTLFLSIAIINIIENRKKKKYVIYSVIILLLISAGFSAFFQHWNSDGKSKFHMSEQIYGAGLWVKDNINDSNKNKNLATNNAMAGRMILAISEVPTLVDEAPAAMLAYGFVNKKNINVSMNSISSTSFYQDNPYILISRNDIYEDFYGLGTYHINKARILLARYNLSYALIYRNLRDNSFYDSVEKAKNNIYNNGDITIWHLD